MISYIENRKDTKINFKKLQDTKSVYKIQSDFYTITIDYLGE
jgi:hypothetical protein